MNKFISLGIIVLLISCQETPKEQPAIGSKKLTYSITGADKTLKQEDLFDAAGKLLKTIYFGNRTNDTLNIVTYYYSGDLLVEQITSKPNGNITDKSVYDYTLGTLTGEAYIKGEDTLYQKYYAYFDNGSLRRIATVFLKEKNNPVTTVTYYDQQGNIEKIYNQIYEDSTKIVLSRYEMQSFINVYNTDGKITSSTSTMLFGYYEITDTISVTQFHYDNSGNLVSQINTKKSSRTEPDSLAYRYNADNLLSTKIIYNKVRQQKEVVSVIDTTSYIYDTNSRLIKEFSTTAQTGFMYSYE